MATELDYLFRNCWALENIDLSSFNTSKVQLTISMFENCYGLKELDLTSFTFPNFRTPGLCSLDVTIWRKCIFPATAIP